MPQKTPRGPKESRLETKRSCLTRNPSPKTEKTSRTGSLLTEAQDNTLHKVRTTAFFSYQGPAEYIFFPLFCNVHVIDTLYVKTLFKNKAQNCCLLALKMLITPPLTSIVFSYRLLIVLLVQSDIPQHILGRRWSEKILILCTNEVKPVCIIVSDSQVHILFIGLSNIRKTQSYLTMAENCLIRNSLILKERETWESHARTKDKDFFLRFMWRYVLSFFHIHLHIKHHILICLQRVPRD